MVAEVEVKTEAAAAETVATVEVKAEEVVADKVIKPTRAKRVPKPKVVNGKVKVKKADGAKKIGRASAAMTKTETITTINDIPTAFIASEDRVNYIVSGRSAVTADVINRSSAGPKNPSL